METKQILTAPPRVMRAPDAADLAAKSDRIATFAVAKLCGIPFREAERMIETFRIEG